LKTPGVYFRPCQPFRGTTVFLAMQQQIDSATIKTWERFYRANFINSLTGFKSVSLIGTVNSAGLPNLAVFSSIVHLGSDPALVGYINRPLAAAPHTIENIKATGVYTINHIRPSFVQQAHQTSAKYEAGVNEFEAVKLAPQFQEGIIAPFVADSLVKYALKLEEIVPIKHNNTFLVIGSITTILIDPALIHEDGFLSLEDAGSLASLGGDAYYKPERLVRLSYAKPGKPVEKI
jgi:flavin reductase (DIM6/NTAB) family NADH-FMN oxidoreductase RutF